MKNVSKNVLFVIIIFAGGIGITIGLGFIFEILNIPYNEDLVENRIKRISEPLNWVEENISKNLP